jgi:hypothetical protein
MSCIQKGGVVLMYGSLGGQSFQPGLANILFRDVRLHGFYLSNWIDRLAPDQFHEFSNTVMMLLADGVMQTRTVEVFPLALFKQAILRSQVKSLNFTLLDFFIYLASNKCFVLQYSCEVTQPSLRHVFLIWALYQRF